MSSKSEVKLINFETGLIATHDNIQLSDLKSSESEILSRAIHWQLSKRRAGSANVKDMSQISGTTKKPYKQKGTGNARHGSKRSVQFVGGRTCHGPKTRSFKHSLPKKIVSNSINIAIRNKLLENNVYVFDNYLGQDLKTSKFANILSKSKINSCLIVFDDSETFEKVGKFIKNLKNIKAISFEFLNAYDLTKYSSLIIDKKVYDNKIKSYL